MKTRLVVLATTFLLMILAETLAAHHDVVAKFDSGKEITVTGSVVRVAWLNPHASLVINVKGANGRTESWQVEIAPPHALESMGVKKDTVAVSSSVTGKMWPARDGSHLASGRLLTLSNGNELNVADALGWKQLH